MASHRPQVNSDSSFFLREKQAARLLGVAHSTLKRWRYQHRVPYIDLSDSGTDHGVILYDPEALIQWVRQHRIEPET